MTISTKTEVPMSPEPRHPVPPAPIHPMAALATLVLDNVFGIFEIVDPFLLVLTSVSVGVIGAVTTAFVQRYLAKDGWGASVAKGLVMGVIAGVPFQVTGTAAGAILLGWAGASQWIKLPAPKNKPIIDDDQEIIEAKVREEK